MIVFLYFCTGNDNIHTFSNLDDSELRVDMSSNDGTDAYAHYSSFSVGDAASGYVLSVAGYSGDAGK